MRRALAGGLALSCAACALLLLADASFPFPFARLSRAPATVVLDRDGAEVVGGVAVVRFGENPLRTIENIKGVIDEIAPPYMAP